LYDGKPLRDSIDDYIDTSDNDINFEDKNYLRLILSYISGFSIPKSWKKRR
jgi:hypothetical protein